MKKKAFTLIEIISVVIIIGVLAGIAGVSFLKVLRTAIEKDAILKLETIWSANEIYRIKNGHYWKGEDAVLNCVTQTNEINAGLGIDLNVDSGANLIYQYCANNSSFFVWVSIFYGAANWNIIIRDPSVQTGANPNPCCLVSAFMTPCLTLPWCP